MRGKKAKQLRKKIYGDYSHKARRYMRLDSGQIINAPDSLRSKYLKAKNGKKSFFRYDIEVKFGHRKG